MANTTATPFSNGGAAESFDISAVLTAEIAPLSEDQLRRCSDAVDFFEEKMSSLQTIHKEFEILQENVMEEMEMKNKCSISNTKENDLKNRYRNDVLPFDDNRVILKQYEDYTPSPTGYINASFISTVGSVSKFIATQGPTQETSEDFWEMILQYRCPAIVMLTPLRDHNKVDKCGDYLQLEDGASEFRDISIVTRWKQTRESSLILRCIEVKRKKVCRALTSVLG